MDLKSLLVDSKTTWVEFPGLEGFEVELANLSRKELVNLRKRCTTNKFNRKTRQFEDELNDDKFVKEFTKATVKNWKGLQLGYLEDLILVDLKGQDPKVGMLLELRTPNGISVPTRISEVTEEDVTIDLNHPLAGKTLIFQIKVIDIL